MGYGVFGQSAWVISEDYDIRFDGTKAQGTFKGLEGTIQFDPDIPENALFDVSVEVATISTGNRTKDKHARGKDWFFAEKFPRIRFKSTSVESASTGYRLLGELDLRGVKKEVVLPFTFSGRGDVGEFIGTLKVNRQDYGIKGPFLGFLVGDDFEVFLRVPVKRDVLP